MEPKFNIDRPKISDDEINQRKDFDRLVKEFKERSLKQAQGDESWRKNKKIRYTAIIAGVTVVCTVTLYTLLKKQNQTTRHETLTTTTSQASLTTPAPKKRTVNAPSDRLTIPYARYRVSAGKGGSITHGSSSKIKVPAGCFVNKKGEEIVGDVTIEYREFHDHGDVIASGIPMAYDSANAKYNFESAGMFDIRGYQDGEPVFIKPDKTLEVQLASRTPDNRFNQYFLDTVAGNWQYLKKDHATPLRSKKENTQHTAAETPKMRALKEEIETTIPNKINNVKAVYELKIKQLPRPDAPFKPAKATGRPTFKLDGSYSEFPELAAFNNVVFEVGTENSNYSKEFHKIVWSDARISQGPVKGRNYILNLSYRDRSEKLVVYPVLSGNDLAKAEEMYAEKFSTYETLAQKRKADEARLAAEMQAKQKAYVDELKRKQEQYDKEKANMLAKYNVAEQNELAANFNAMSNAARATRLFSVSRFGIFNSDCPHSLPAGNATVPVFVFNERTISADAVYLVDHSGKMVYSYTPANLKFVCKPENVYSICIFNKNNIYLCNKMAFQEAFARGDNRFTVTALTEGSDNLPDFKKALEI